MSVGLWYAYQFQCSTGIGARREDFLGSKFAGVASTATAFGGTGLPPCPAYDFSCAFRETLARTIEPGEKGTPPNLKDGSAAFATDVETTLKATISWPTKSNLFKKTGVRMSSGNQHQAGLGSSSSFTALRLLIAEDHVRRGFAHFKLRAHLL